MKRIAPGCASFHSYVTLCDKRSLTNRRTTARPIHPRGAVMDETSEASDPQTYYVDCSWGSGEIQAITEDGECGVSGRIPGFSAGLPCQ